MPVAVLVMRAPKGTGRGVLNVRAVKRTNSRMRSSSSLVTPLDLRPLAPMSQFSMFQREDNAKNERRQIEYLV